MLRKELVLENPLVNSTGEDRTKRMKDLKEERGLRSFNC